MNWVINKITKHEGYSVVEIRCPYCGYKQTFHDIPKELTCYVCGHYSEYKEDPRGNILYLCDCNSRTDCKKTSCKALGYGDCRHTCKREHSLNWKDRKPTMSELKKQFEIPPSVDRVYFVERDEA